MLQSLVDHRMTAVQASHEVGKPCRLDTPLPTPTGWTTVGDVRVGERVFDEEGRPCRVTGKGPVFDDDAYRVTFADRSFVDTRGSHEWSALDLRRRRKGVNDWRDHWDDAVTVTTAEIRDTLRTSGGQLRWRIPVARPLDLPRAELPIGSYELGCWLGDGDTSTNAITLNRADAEEIVPRFEALGHVVEYVPSRRHGEERVDVFRCRLSGLTRSGLRDIGVLGNKHIPAAYLRASIEQRRELLRGLMDTDGYRGSKGADEITLTCKPLFDGFVELVHSLGLIAYQYEGEAKIAGRSYGPKFRCYFRADFNPYHLTRYSWAPRAAQGSKHTQRTIVSVEPIEGRSQCIEVDSPRHLFLAGRSMIPTHNSFIASRVIAWWLDPRTHHVGDAFAVWTAPTYPQVNAIIGRELRGVVKKAQLPGKLNMANEFTHDGILIGYGRKPADHDEHGFQGIHDRYVLVIVDEACGIPPQLWEAISSLAGNDNARILAIGNPTDPSAHFEKLCRPGSSWNRIRISAFDSPNFTEERVARFPRVKAYMEENGLPYSTEQIDDDVREMLVEPVWVDEAITTYGIESSYFASRVCGDFPKVSNDTLITPAMVRAAQDIELVGMEDGCYAFDIARYGADETVGYRNRGGVIRRCYTARGQDTMATVAGIREELDSRKGSVPAWIDVVGLGAGVFDRLKELGYRVHAFSAGNRARRPDRFVNLRAEVFWTFREAMIDGLVDLPPDGEDDELASQLQSIRYFVTSDKRIGIESKDDMKKRGLPSPDRADAAVMAWMDAPAFRDYWLAQAEERRIEKATGSTARVGSSITGDLMDRPL